MGKDWTDDQRRARSEANIHENWGGQCVQHMRDIQLLQPGRMSTTLLCILSRASKTYRFEAFLEEIRPQLQSNRPSHFSGGAKQYASGGRYIQPTDVKKVLHQSYVTSEHPIMTSEGQAPAKPNEVKNNIIYGDASDGLNHSSLVPAHQSALCEDISLSSTTIAAVQTAMSMFDIPALTQLLSSSHGIVNGTISPII